MRRRVRLLERRQHSARVRLLDVHQHVGVGKLFQAARLLALVLLRRQAIAVPAVIVLEDLLIRDGRDAVVVKLEPPAVLFRLDQREIVAAVQVA